MNKERKIQDCVVAVIGGAGFLGSHLVNHLIDDRNCEVIVIDNLVSGNIKFVHPKAQDKAFLGKDISDECAESMLYAYFKHYKGEYVFNYAADPYIPDSFKTPSRVFNTNAVGTLNVLNAGKKAGVKGILQVSSAEIYGDCEGKINETSPVCPHSTYGASKVAADFLVQARWKEDQVPAIALRQFNCVGEKETHPYIVPEIISQLTHTREVRLGNNSYRDFMYAGDAVRMAVELLEKGNFGEVYNLGSEDYTSIYNLAYKIGGIICPTWTAPVITDKSRMRPWEIWHLQSDNTKIYSTIDTRPVVSLEEALKRTISYFQENGQKWVWEEMCSS